jgi:hypothetical protein
MLYNISYIKTFDEFVISKKLTGVYKLGKGFDTADKALYYLFDNFGKIINKFECPNKNKIKIELSKGSIELTKDGTMLYNNNEPLNIQKAVKLIELSDIEMKPEEKYNI